MPLVSATYSGVATVTIARRAAGWEAHSCLCATLVLTELAAAVRNSVHTSLRVARASTALIGAWPAVNCTNGINLVRQTHRLGR